MHTHALRGCLATDVENTSGAGLNPYTDAIAIQLGAGAGTAAGAESGAVGSKHCLTLEAGDMQQVHYEVQQSWLFFLPVV
jgi:hypothetical protein